MNNTSPASLDGPVRTQAAPRRSSWIVSLTGICFLFGGMMAVQVRAVQQARIDQQQEAAGTEIKIKNLTAMQRELSKEQAAKKQAEKALKEAQIKLRTGYVSKKEALQLNDQVQDLRRVAGLTAMRGEGVVITLRDDPQASKAGGGSFLPGLVHDFDLQQTVHELLLNKAEAIAIKGVGGEPIRITSYTPIRCVGSPIFVNFKPVAAPYTIMAIGDAASLKSALEMPDGIADQMKKQNLGVKITVSENLRLPAAEGMPTFRSAKSVDPTIAAR